MPGNKATTKLKDKLRIGEAARLLGITTTTLRRWDKSGFLKPDSQIGPRKDRRYTKEQILYVLEHGIKEEE